MTKLEMIETLMLLSALESYIYAIGDNKRMPEHLSESIMEAAGRLQRGILDVDPTNC